MFVQLLDLALQVAVHEVAKVNDESICDLVVGTASPVLPLSRGEFFSVGVNDSEDCKGGPAAGMFAVAVDADSVARFVRNQQLIFLRRFTSGQTLVRSQVV